MLPLHDSVLIVPGFLDFTHVRNTGAAFGLLNAVDFPFKTALIALDRAWRRSSASACTRPASRSHQVLARVGLALIIGGAAGNLIDRVVVGSVVDFVDVYWRTLSLLGLQRRRLGDHGRRGDHDSRYARHRARMYPRLFELGRLTVYTYGVLLAAAYLLGLKLAMVRAKARGLDQTRVLDLGIYIIISALVGAKLLLLVTDFRTFTEQSARAADARALGRRVLRRPDPRRRGRARGTSGASACRSGRPAMCSRRASRSATSSAGSAASSRAAATASRPTCRGRSRSPIRSRRTNVGTPLNVPLHPTQLYEAGAEAADPAAPARPPRRGAGRSRAGRSGSTCCSTSISRFVIEIYRGDPRGSRLACSRRRSSSRCCSRRSAIGMLRLSWPPPGAGTEARAQGGVASMRDRRRLGTATADGVRLDRFVVSALARPLALVRFSVCITARRIASVCSHRSQIQRLIKEGHVPSPGGGEGEPARQSGQPMSSTSPSRSTRCRSPKRCRCRSSTRTAT